ncbi:MAG: thioesterase family protein [Clostridia bacterium]|nr:thioesterase family protein [Clostridia bacterium]
MTTTTVLEVRYAETDMMGIMHHSRYYPWFEVARTEFIKQVGMTYSKMEKMGVMIPLTETQAKYISGLKYEERAEVSCTLFELSAARCGFKYTVKRLSDGKITTTGITRHGFVDREFKAINLKKKFPELYTRFESLLEN